VHDTRVITADSPPAALFSAIIDDIVMPACILNVKQKNQDRSGTFDVTFYLRVFLGKCE
jgi:hypothetical protein